MIPNKIRKTFAFEFAPFSSTEDDLLYDQYS